MGERILIHHVLEVHLPSAFLNLRRRCEFHADDGLKFVDGLKTTVCVVVVAFVHKNAEVGQGL